MSLIEMFNKKSKSKEKVEYPSKVEVYDKSKELPNDFRQKVQAEKKQLLGKDTLTREELYKEIEKYYNSKKFNDNNPFKTREDIFITFFHSDNSIKRDS